MCYQNLAFKATCGSVELGALSSYKHHASALGGLMRKFLKERSRPLLADLQGMLPKGALLLEYGMV